MDPIVLYAIIGTKNFCKECEDSSSIFLNPIVKDTVLKIEILSTVMFAIFLLSCPFTVGSAIYSIATHTVVPFFISLGIPVVSFSSSLLLLNKASTINDCHSKLSKNQNKVIDKTFKIFFTTVFSSYAILLGAHCYNNYKN